MWHFKHNKIHLYIIRPCSSFTVFCKLSLYDSQRSHTHNYTVAPLTQYIHTHTLTQYILARMHVHTDLVMWCLLNMITFKRTHTDHLMPYIINHIS